MKMQIGELIAAGGVACLILSLFFLIGSSIGSGVNLFFYADLGDVTRISFMWLPGSVAVVLVGVFLTDKRPFVEGAAYYAKEPAIDKVLRRHGLPMLTAVIGVASLVLYLMGRQPRSIMFAGTGASVLFGWMWYGFRLWDRSPLADKVSDELWLAFISVPVAILMAVVTGLVHGAGGGWAFLPTNSVEVHSTDEVVSGQIFMRFNGFFLIKPSQPDTVVIIPTSRVDHIVYPHAKIEGGSAFRPPAAGSTPPAGASDTATDTE